MIDDKDKFPDDLLEEIQRDASRYRLPKISNRDHALFLVDELDLEAQLIAIKGALQRNKAAEDATSASIDDLKEYIASYAGGNEEYQMHIEGQWADTMHNTVFQDAAHSMAAVGMLAPLVESLFVAIFVGLREGIAPNTATGPRSTGSPDEYWNPKIVFRREGQFPDVVQGIDQLAKAIGLRTYLPSDYNKVMDALFAYRNNMFHNGFEWPAEARQRFNARIEREGWGNWFTKSESGNTPWIFYMSDAFIQQCLTMIDDILDGVGKYLARNED